MEHHAVLGFLSGTRSIKDKHKHRENREQSANIPMRSVTTGHDWNIVDTNE